MFKRLIAWYQRKRLARLFDICARTGGEGSPWFEEYKQYLEKINEKPSST